MVSLERTVTVSKLPVELEHKIFTTATRSDRGAATTFLRIAKRVHEWVEPIIWEEATLSNQKQEAAFVKAIQSKPPAFVAQHVKHVLFSWDADCENVEGILNACKGIRSLACWMSPDEAAQIARLPALNRLSTQIDVFLEAITDQAHGQSLRNSLTHLCIADLPPDEWNGETHEKLLDPELLPHLTHLVLFLDCSDIELEWDPANIFSALKSLKVFVIVIENRDSLEPNEVKELNVKLRHPSIVLFPFENVELEDDWHDFVDGKADIWDKAENVIAGRVRAQDSDAYAFGPGIVGTIFHDVEEETQGDSDDDKSQSSG